MLFFVLDSPENAFYFQALRLASFWDPATPRLKKLPGIDPVAQTIVRNTSG
ncbi:hypothetical protein MPNT_20063 [Candidatus Methylacidithermus pantelleriae]|uniref:Uncharacterized protein n=1 Tax=Candidatus Methylacidithermus pantelleriae TaxID=2744239 RepID=A0A8J2FP02_9BACT|nr:hypothetical protein MPNT_20063 [Candidatus Methylacidithermus pantelleriae]